MSIHRAAAGTLTCPGSLRATFGHKEFGIYLIAREPCQLTIGAHVATPDSAITTARIPLPLAREPQVEQQKFICGGCYFIYEPASGLPDQAIASGTPFAKISSDWRCPDCGTEKTTFRPYVEPDHRQSSVKRQTV